MWLWQGGDAAGEYYAGYLIEKSLSIDNVFVWALVMSYFGVPQKYQFRVLFWGIFGALVLRAIFIFGGVAILERFSWVIYVFGAFLLFTAIRLLTPSHDDVHPEDNLILRLVNKVVPSTNEYDGQTLFTVQNGKRLATPLSAVLVVVDARKRVRVRSFVAFVLRAIFIFGGVAILERFSWVIYVFGAFLLFTAIRLLKPSHDDVHPEDNLILRLVNKVVPSTNEYDGQKLFTVQNGKRLATPLFAVLVVVESSDVIFAVDSIPAILAVSREEFIVFSSNAFAILGLRALYFLLADLRNRFRYLQQGLAVVLAFVGIKMLGSEEHTSELQSLMRISYAVFCLTKH